MTGKELGRERVDGQQTNSGVYGGLTKREHFAGLTVQGLLAAVCKEAENAGEDRNGDLHLAKREVNVADALLDELAKEDGK